ncbi:hypothetical protein HYV11_04160 [Candidatus Dependentiae bacterium]|nr:hypothetical protein [Candidatus Dependentiae bacterium]
MYTREKFGIDLKSKVNKREDIIAIAHWAYSLYLEQDVEESLNDIFLALASMEENYQFEYSYDELLDIADRLIAGEDVTL